MAKLDLKQIRLGVCGFLLVLVVSLLSLKPYLPKAILHLSPSISDSRLFSNREISAATSAQPWIKSTQTYPAPGEDSEKLFRDLDTTALLLIDQGKLAFESYANGGSEDSRSGSFEMAKSVVAVLVGFALQDHRIRSLDEPVSHYITEWEDREEGKIPLRNFLNHSSGLHWNEGLTHPFSMTSEAYYGSDLHFTALRQRRERDAGALFRDQSGDTQVMGLALSRAVNTSLASYASKKLWIPLGAEKTAQWSLDHEEGMEKAFCCISATARDYARVGELIRANGAWQGKTFLNSEYVKAMLEASLIPGEAGKPTENRGFHWWIYPASMTPAGAGQISYARGFLGQYLIVIPSLGRVVVRLGKHSQRDGNEIPDELKALVEWACAKR